MGGVLISIIMIVIPSMTTLTLFQPTNAFRVPRSLIYYTTNSKRRDGTSGRRYPKKQDVGVRRLTHSGRRFTYTYEYGLRRPPLRAPARSVSVYVQLWLRTRARLQMYSIATAHLLNKPRPDGYGPYGYLLGTPVRARARSIYRRYPYLILTHTLK